MDKNRCDCGLVARDDECPADCPRTAAADSDSGMVAVVLDVSARIDEGDDDSSTLVFLVEEPASGAKIQASFPFSPESATLARSMPSAFARLFNDFLEDFERATESAD